MILSFRGMTIKEFFFIKTKTKLLITGLYLT